MGYTESYGLGVRDCFLLFLDENGEATNCNMIMDGDLNITDLDFNVREANLSLITTNLAIGEGIGNTILVDATKEELCGN